MMKVQDLEIEKELFPLFNYTSHRLAGEALLELLTNIPESVQEILDRQSIINGFIDGWNKLQQFSYSKADLHEAYGFLTSHTHVEDISVTEWRFSLTINSAKKQQLRSSLIQILLLFHKLNNYFVQLPTGSFPPSFGRLIQQIQQFFSSFQVTRYEPMILNGGFNISDIIRVVQVIRQKTASLEMAAFWKNLFLFEAWHSIAKAHIKNNFCFPVFTDDRFAITGLYHPLLKDPVKNSIHKSHNVVLLTGPNMSGKSTLLKSLGLCVYLGHLGLGVPASTCQMPFFHTICIAINLKDDLKSGYSHFLSEIKTLKQVVSAAATNKRCFAVFDELFRGTNLEDALEISKTTIQGLTKFQDSLFFISTHLHQLKERIDLHSISTHYIECTINNNLPVFTYTLKPGWSDVKIGQLLFEQEGLNKLLR